MKAILLALAALFWCLTTVALRAEEVISEEALLQHGIICDTAEEVEQGLRQAEGAPSPPGCGMLSSPALVRITKIKQVIIDNVVYTIVRFDPLHQPNPVPQFGFSRLVRNQTSA